MTGSEAASLEQAKDIADLRLVEDADGLVLQITNLRHAPVEFRGVPKSSDGSKEEISILVPPLQTVPVMRLGDGDKESARSRLVEDYSFSSVLGHADAVEADLEHRYRLPFAEGKTYRISQGFNGKRSHTSERSRYAVDFQLEIGEPVFAARAGTVVRAVDWFCEQGGKALIDQTNLVIIMHDDGTLANYVHLDHNGVFVHEGEKVARGQKIGVAGVTGFSSGPHLHFVVRRERDIAIPVKFEGFEDADFSKNLKVRVP